MGSSKEHRTYKRSKDSPTCRRWGMQRNQRERLERSGQDDRRETGKVWTPRSWLENLFPWFTLHWIDAFELWCWRRLLPWTARRSNQSILKEISPEHSMEGLVLKLKLQYFGRLMQRTDSLEKTLMLGKIEGGRRGDDRGWDGWMASPTWWTWVWASSRSWWWTGKPAVLLSTGSQTVGHDWATELNTSLTNVSRIHCLLVSPHSTWALGGIHIIQLCLSLKILLSLDLIHNELFPVPLFYFLYSFSGFQYLFPSQQYFPGTCFALSFYFPLHGFSYPIPWFWQLPANWWFPIHISNADLSSISRFIFPLSPGCVRDAQTPHAHDGIIVCPTGPDLVLVFKHSTSWGGNVAVILFQRSASFFLRGRW